MAGDRFRCIHSRHQPLAGGLFVAAGTVDLPGGEEVVVPFDPEGSFQLVRIEEVVFNRIGVTGDHRLFQPRHRTDHLPLHLGRQAGGDSINIELFRLGTFRLQIEQVTRMLRKTNHLIFKRGAVTCADPFDNPLIHRRIL